MDDSISFHMPEEDKENGKTRNQAAWDVRQKGVDSSCDLRAMIHPAYPIGAVRRGEEGTVVLRITVGENGRAVDVAVEKTSGYPALDRSAVRAVERADFVSPDGTDSQGGEIVLPFTYRLVDR